MNPLNILGVETRNGFKTVELLQGDIARLGFPVDVLVLSAFAGGYSASQGTVIRALREAHGIDVGREHQAPYLDMRAALGLWVSGPLAETAQIRRLMCIELHGSGLPLEEVLDNTFAGLALLEAKGEPVVTVAMPLLGTGLQQLPAELIAPMLTSRARTYLERSATTKRLVFAEIDRSKAHLVSEAMDRHLGRKKVTLPQEQLVSALRDDIKSRIHGARTLFSNCESLQQEWMLLLQKPEIRSVEFGILSRKLVELYVRRNGGSKGQLAVAIRDLEKAGKVAPWLCAYMNVLRHIGNEAAHENVSDSGRIPPVLAPADLTAGLFCVLRLLDAWSDFESAADSRHM